MSDILQVNVPKAADVLAGLLRERILRGELPEGTDLPTERDLGEQAGVSRATVREALRILDIEGLIDTRVGRNGGSFVARRRSLLKGLVAAIELDQVVFGAVQCGEAGRRGFDRGAGL